MRSSIFNVSLNAIFEQIHFIVFVITFALLTSCENDLKKIHSTLDRSLLNQEKAEGVVILYSKEGHTKAQLFTKTFSHIQNTKPSYVEMRNGLRVEFYNDSLQIITTLTAKYGKLFEETGNVLVRDSVVVTNDKKEQLNTEELVWNEGAQKFFTEKFVKISTPTQVIYGDGLESNQTFTEYKITNVKGIIGVSNNVVPN